MTTIDFATSFLGKPLVTAMQGEIKNAHRVFEQLQSGTCRGHEWTGWWRYPQDRGLAELETIIAARDALQVDYDAVVVVGIGGSYLGTRATEAALRQTAGGSHLKKIFYCGHHLSEGSFLEFLKNIEGHRPLVCMVSKSGTTTEPGVCFRILRHWLEEKFQDAAQRIIAITDANKGALRQCAQENNWLSFTIPDDVGGRFSILSPVGMVPLAFAGADCKGIL